MRSSPQTILPCWAVKARLQAFSLLVQCPDILSLFQCGSCWWSISSAKSTKINTLRLPFSGKEITVITVMEQIGCSEEDMVSAFGARWVTSIEKELPYARRRKFFDCKLATISSMDFDENTEQRTPYWDNIITEAFRSNAWRRLLSLIIKTSNTSKAKLKARKHVPPPQVPTTFCSSTIIKLPIIVTTTIDVVKPPPPLVINHATTQPNSPQFVPAKPYNRLISSEPTTSSTSKETGIDELVKNINTTINFVLAYKSLDVLPMKLSKPLQSFAH